MAISYTCRCGRTELYSSVPPPQCQGCEHCGSRFVNGSSYARPKVLHAFVLRQVQTDEGRRDDV